MGNKLGRKRQVVDDKYTRPQGLYQQRDVDQKKLRKLILDSKLAPCYPGDEECTLVDLEECPICFLYYPSLNRSRCCMKGICTECFLQMKPPHSARPTQCPFCKTSNYAVEYRGMRTKEEKRKDQIEEQRFIEAKIRMQQQERHNAEEEVNKGQAQYPSSTAMVSGEVERRDLSTSSVAVTADRHVTQDDTFLSSQSSFILPTSRRLLTSMHNRECELDLDLEEMMIKEAIQLSIQEQDNYSRNHPATAGAVSSDSSCTGDYSSHAVIPVGASSSNRLAFPAAALAECQRLRGDSASPAGVNSDSFVTSPNLSCLATGNERLVQDCHDDSCIEASSGCGGVTSTEDSEWAIDHASEVAEAGTSYASSDITLDSGTGLPCPETVSVASGHFLPDTFEEQMLLAMAISLADARETQGTAAWPYAS